MKGNSKAARNSARGPSNEYDKLIAELERVQKHLEKFIDIAKAASSGRLLDAGYAFTRDKELSSKVIRSLIEATSAIENAGLETKIMGESQTARLSYRSRLEELLGASSLEIKGEWSSYLIADLIRLEVDIERGNATVNGKACTSMEPSHLVKTVKARISELLDRPFVATQFLQTLKESYLELISAQRLSFGDYVDIRQVFTKLRVEMKTSGFDRRYSEQKFGADLFRLFMNVSSLTGEVMKIELSPAQNAMGGMYIPAQGGGNYIAAIRLISVTHAG